MSLLENMPHTIRIERVAYNRDNLVGNTESRTTVVSGVEAWVQTVSEREIREFQKRDEEITDKVYFNFQPPLQVGDHIIVTDGPSHVGEDLLFLAKHERTAGIGWAYKALCRVETNEYADESSTTSARSSSSSSSSCSSCSSPSSASCSSQSTQSSTSLSSQSSESSSSCSSGGGCSCEVGTLSSPASTGTQTITHSLGVAPKAIIIWTTQETADGTSTDALLGMGFATSSTNRATVAANYPDGGGFTEDRYHSESAVIATTNGSGTVIELADLDSFSASDFVLDWTTVSATAIRYHYMLLAGDSLEANVVQVVANTVDSTTQNVAHGLSGAPDCALAMSVHALSAPPGSDGAAESGFTFGASDMTNDRAASVIQTVGTHDSYNNTKFLLHAQAGGLAIEEAVVNAVDGTNIQLLWEKADSAEYYYLLCLKGCTFEVGSYTSPSSASTRTVTTGLSSVVGFITWASRPPSASPNAMITFGASDGTNQATVGMIGEDTVDAADRFNNDGKVLEWRDPSDASIVEDATASFSGADVNVVFATAEAANNTYYYVAFG